jgi:RNA polymerase sigma-70 factor, ECF subfamily
MTDYSELSEENLVSKSAKGDRASFEELLARNKPKIQGWILSFTKQSDLVQDIFQISCFKGWKYIAKFRKDCKFSTWMCNIARNTFYDYYRARQRRPEISLDEIMAKQMESGGNFEFHCLGTEDHPRSKDEDSNYYISKIDKMLDSLGEKHKEPLMLFLRDGLEYTEIAKKLNCPVGTVMSRIFYARKKAQKILNPLKNEFATR